MRARTLFEKIDDHYILYSAGIGIILNILYGPKPADPIGAGLIFAFLGGMIWYFLKAVFITTGTINNWEKTNPGEPMFKAGGLTEYDREFAKQIGESAEAARRKNERKDAHE